MIPFILQRQILKQLHSNHMAIKMRLLTKKLVYLVNINADIKDTIKWCATCLEYQHTQPLEKTIQYKVPCKLWKVVGADIFSIKNKTLLCIVDYYSKFPLVRKAGSLTADDLVKAAKIVFGLPKKIISDAGMNFTPEMFRQLSRQMNIQQAITSSYHLQSNGQVDMCITFMAGLHSPVTLLFNRSIRGLLPQMNREPINTNNDDA